MTPENRTAHDTLETTDGRPTLRLQRTLAHPVQRVWRAVSEPAELAQWFPAAAGWTPTEGEAFEAYGMTGQVTEVDAPHRLAWTFATETYRFELEPEGDGCRLTFTHSFEDRDRAAQTAAGWDAYLSRLLPHLDGGHLTEQDAHRPWEAVHEIYADRFGVDPTPGRAFIAAQRTTP